MVKKTSTRFKRYGRDQRYNCIIAEERKKKEALAVKKLLEIIS